MIWVLKLDSAVRCSIEHCNSFIAYEDVKNTAKIIIKNKAVKDFSKFVLINEVRRLKSLL